MKAIQRTSKTSGKRPERPLHPSLTRALLQPRQPASCPGESQLAALAEGKVSPTERRDLHSHLAECEACLEAYTLLQDLIPPHAAKTHRFHRPLALAASLVLVILSLYLISPRLRETPAPGIGEDRNDAVMELQPAAQRPEAVKKEESASPRPRRGSKPADSVGKVRRTKSAERRDKGVAPPPIARPGAGKEPELEAKVHTDDTTLNAEGMEPPKPAARLNGKGIRTAARFRNRPQEPAISAPPPDTPPGRLQVWVRVTAEGRIRDTVFDPPDSPLVPPVRRALKSGRIPEPFPRRGNWLLRISWDGEFWQVQVSPFSGSPGPGKGASS